MFRKMIAGFPHGRAGMALVLSGAMAPERPGAGRAGRLLRAPGGARARRS
jgi:hypothetical protein